MEYPSETKNASAFEKEGEMIDPPPPFKEKDSSTSTEQPVPNQQATKRQPQHKQTKAAKTLLAPLPQPLDVWSDETFCAGSGASSPHVSCTDCDCEQ